MKTTVYFGCPETEQVSVKGQAMSRERKARYKYCETPKLTNTRILTLKVKHL